MTRSHKLTAIVASLVIAASFLVTASVSSFAQQRPSEEQMLNALRSRPATQDLAPKTRGLTLNAGQDDNDNRRFIDSIRGRTRQLTTGERKQVAKIAKERPNIDLEIYFDYNSAAITADAEPELMKLGRVLTNAELKGGTFLIGGHTDARGGESYNQRLSEARAQSVKRFLQDRFDLPKDALVAAGYGKEELKNREDPNAAENRRVQIVNLDQKETARR